MAITDAISSQTESHFDVVVVLLDGDYLGRGEVISVPKDVEVAIGRRRGVGGGCVVDGEGDDEVEVHMWVYGDVGELDTVELSTNVFSEEIS